MSKNRRFWQIHLSTALVLMLAMGFMLWLNLGTCAFRSGGSSGENEVYGWPKNFEKYVHYRDGEVDSKEWVNEDNELSVAVIENAIVALTISVGLAFVFEFIARHREVRDP